MIFSIILIAYFSLEIRDRLLFVLFAFPNMIRIRELYIGGHEMGYISMKSQFQYDQFCVSFRYVMHHHVTIFSKKEKYWVYRKL